MPRALPSSGKTIKSWILEQFHRAQQSLTRLFRQSRSKVHFTFDMWTSPNYKAFLRVVAHWLNFDYKLQSTVLGMRRFYGRHTGENLASCFLEIVEPYSIIDKIGYFTLDNASNNDTALQYIAEHLKEQDIPFDPIQRRLRSFGHVINLVVKSFLWGSDAEVFEAQISTFQDLEQEVAELEAWRRKGPLGKLHNIIIWISRSPQRRERFQAEVRKALGPNTKAVSLIRSNTTRWGSDYDSLIRAFELRDPLEEFVSRVLRRNEDQEQNGTPASLHLDELTTADWEILREIMHILQPFRKWQLILQSKTHFGQLHDIFPAMDELLYQLEQSREHDIPHIRTSVNLAWNVLNKYNHSTSPILSIDLFLVQSLYILDITH